LVKIILRLLVEAVVIALLVIFVAGYIEPLWLLIALASGSVLPVVLQRNTEQLVKVVVAAVLFGAVGAIVGWQLERGVKLGVLQGWACMGLLLVLTVMVALVHRGMLRLAVKHILDEHIDLVQQREIRKAYQDTLSESYRAVISLERFSTLSQGQQRLYHSSKWKIDELSWDDGEATAYVVAADDDDAHRFRFTLRKESVGWRVDEVMPV